ncbi:MAG TPA: hypothetical protein VGG74_06040 [Kofleriaceae bacterium]|jgi:hypothetical protein
MNRFEIVTALAVASLVACASGERSNQNQGNPGAPSDAPGTTNQTDAQGAAPDASNAIAADASIDAPVDAPPLVTDPFDPASCASPPITQAQLVAKFAMGAATATLGTYTFAAERRFCNAQTGCTAWSVVTAKVQLEDPPSIIYMGSAGTFTADANSWFSFAYDFNAGSDAGNFGAGCNLTNPLDTSPNISGCGTWDLRATDVQSDWMDPQWSGILANDCARITASTTSDGYEYQWVMLAQF